MFRAREIIRLETRIRWDTETINSVRGVLWRLTDGRWTVDKPGDPIPIPAIVICRSTSSKGKGSQSKTSMSSEPLWNAQVATQSRTTNGHKPIQTVAESELKNASGKTPPRSTIDR